MGAFIAPIPVFITGLSPKPQFKVCQTMSAVQSSFVEGQGQSTNGQVISQDEINNILWRACDTFRGTVDPSEYKNYILVMLFLKYISDVWSDRRAQYEE